VRIDDLKDSKVQEQLNMQPTDHLSHCFKPSRLGCSSILITYLMCTAPSHQTINNNKQYTKEVMGTCGQSSIQVQLLTNGIAGIVYSELHSGTVTDEW
jgi:hypothetical protein